MEGMRPRTTPSELASDQVARKRQCAERHGARIDDWVAGGRVIVRHVTVEGLGHAWSGGDASLAFHDAGPPDATALLATFFADVLSLRPEGVKKRWRFWG